VHRFVGGVAVIQRTDEKHDLGNFDWFNDSCDTAGWLRAMGRDAEAGEIEEGYKWYLTNSRKPPVCDCGRLAINSVGEDLGECQDCFETTASDLWWDHLDAGQRAMDAGE
jgi:hypothetical protein